MYLSHIRLKGGMKIKTPLRFKVLAPKVLNRNSCIPPGHSGNSASNKMAMRNQFLHHPIGLAAGSLGNANPLPHSAYPIDFGNIFL